MLQFEDEKGQLTDADAEALAQLPRGEWFEAAHLPILRPMYRCERLHRAGYLQWKVVGYPDTRSFYRVKD